MIERKFVQAKKDEFSIKEFVKAELGKSRISEVTIDRTPVGEKVTVRTSKPGLVIGKRGERIADLTGMLKKKFNMENPHIEISEITDPDLDAQTVADEIAMSLERFGSIRFKIIAYKMLQRIVSAGALGAEIRLSGKLPSERAKSWRFAFGFLKKTGDTRHAVRIAKAIARTLPGTVGVKVEIMPQQPKGAVTLEINKDMVIEEVQEGIRQQKAARDSAVPTSSETSKQKTKE